MSLIEEIPSHSPNDKAKQFFRVLDRCQDLVLKDCTLLSFGRRSEADPICLNSKFLLTKVKDLRLFGRLRLIVKKCPQKSHMQSLLISNWNYFDTEDIEKPIQMPKKTRINNASINCLRYLSFEKVNHLTLAYRYGNDSDNYRLPEDIQTSYRIAREATSLQEL